MQNYPICHDVQSLDKYITSSPSPANSLRNYRQIKTKTFSPQLSLCDQRKLNKRCMRTMSGLWSKLRNWWEWITRWFPIDNVVTQIHRKKKNHLHIKCFAVSAFTFFQHFFSLLLFCAPKHFPIFTFTSPDFALFFITLFFPDVVRLSAFLSRLESDL